MHYSKYHGLGNDYLVIRPEDLTQDLDSETVARVCRRRFGIGSDGILLGPLPSDRADFRLKIFNSDGSEAEKSGNGLRIFARFLYDNGLVDEDRFSVETAGGIVACSISDSGRIVSVNMGKVVFDSKAIPMTGRPRQVLNETFVLHGETLTICAASLGNPHCVVLCDEPTPELAKRLGPMIETDPRFPQRTNVQFMKAVSRNRIRIEIWERGSGYTLASGSSSTASAAVAHRLGHCDRDVTVEMPGGTLQLSFDERFAATLIGPVAKVGDGTISPELLAPNSGS